LPLVTTLDASNNKLTRIQWGNQSLSGLQTLTLKSNRLNNNISFRGLANLTTLDISNNTYSGPIQRIFPASLTTLLASRNRFTTLRTTLSIRGFFKVLDLSYNNMTDDLEEFFSRMFGDDITTLQVSHNNFTGQGAIWQYFPKIVYFNASYNNLTFAVNNVVPPSLTTLDVSHNQQEDRILDSLFTDEIQTAFFDHNNMNYNRDNNPGVDLLPSAVLFGFERTIAVENKDGLECPHFILKEKPDSQVTLDPSYHHYYLCRCAPGYFRVQGVFNYCLPCLDHGRCDGMVNPFQLSRSLNIIAHQGYYPVPDANNPQILIECRFGSVVGSS